MTEMTRYEQVISSMTEKPESAEEVGKRFGLRRDEARRVLERGVSLGTIDRYRQPGSQNIRYARAGTAPKQTEVPVIEKDTFVPVKTPGRLVPNPLDRKELNISRLPSPTGPRGEAGEIAIREVGPADDQGLTTEEISELTEGIDAPPPANPSLLASANKMLCDRLDEIADALKVAGFSHADRNNLPELVSEIGTRLLAAEFVPTQTCDCCADMSNELQKAANDCKELREIAESQAKTIERLQHDLKNAQFAAKMESDTLRERLRSEPAANGFFGVIGADDVDVFTRRTPDDAAKMASAEGDIIVEFRKVGVMRQKLTMVCGE